MSDNDSNTDGKDIVSIELGVSRRDLMKQLGGLGLTGGFVGFAGCNTVRDSSTTTNPQQTVGTDQGGAGGDGTDNQANQENGSGSMGSEIPPFQRVPLTPPPTADEIDYADPADPEREVAFVTHNATNQVFVPAIAMMNDAMNHFGWTGEFTGPTGNNQSKQVEILNTKVETLGAGDVLATTVLDPEAYMSPVKTAVENDIAVTQWNTTVGGWDYDFMIENFGLVIPYVGQTHFPAGNAVGVTAYEKAEEQLEADEYVVLATTGVPGHPALQARNEGIRNALARHDNVSVLNLLDVSTDSSQAITRVNDRYNANPDINIILGSGFWAPAAASSLVEDEGLQGEMIVGGFDLPESTLQGIQNGTITFTVGQDPYSQGYITTQLAYEYMDRGIPMKDYITGVSIIDESNIDFASQRSSAWDELVDFQNQNF